MTRYRSSLLLSSALGATLLASLVHARPSIASPTRARPTVVADDDDDDDDAPRKPAAPSGKHPAWCSGIPHNSKSEQSKLEADDDFVESMAAIVVTLCDQRPSDATHHQRAEAMRRKWMARLGMTEVTFAREIHDWLTSDDSGAVNLVAFMEDRGKPLEAEEIAQGGDELEAKPDLGLQLAYDELCLVNKDPRAIAICELDLRRVEPAKLFAQIGDLTKIDGVKLLHARFVVDAVAHRKRPVDPAMLAIVQASRADFDAHEAERAKVRALMAAPKESDPSFEGCATKAVPRLAAALANTSLRVSELVAEQGTYRGIEPSLAFADPEIHIAAWYVAMCRAYPLDGIKTWADTAAEHALPRAREAALRLLDVKLHTERSTRSTQGPNRYVAMPNAFRIANIQDQGDKLRITYVDLGKEERHDCAESVETDHIDHILDDGHVVYTQRCLRAPTTIVDRTPKPVILPKKLAAGVTKGRFLVATNDTLPTVWESPTGLPVAALGALLKP